MPFITRLVLLFSGPATLAVALGGTPELYLAVLRDEPAFGRGKLLTGPRTKLHNFCMGYIDTVVESRDARSLHVEGTLQIGDAEARKESIYQMLVVTAEAGTLIIERQIGDVIEISAGSHSGSFPFSADLALPSGVYRVKVYEARVGATHTDLDGTVGPAIGAAFEYGRVEVH